MTKATQSTRLKGIVALHTGAQQLRNKYRVGTSQELLKNKNKLVRDPKTDDLLCCTNADPDYALYCKYYIHINASTVFLQGSCLS